MAHAVYNKIVYPSKSTYNILNGTVNNGAFLNKEYPINKKNNQNLPGASPTLGQVLLESKLITQEQLDRILVIQKTGDGRRLGTILIDEGIITAESLALALSIHLNLPFADLSQVTINSELIRIIPENVARRYQLIPVEISNGALVVVMEDPTNISVLGELSALTGMNITPSVGVGMNIQSAIDLYYKANKEIEREVAEFSESSELSDVDVDTSAVLEDPVVRAVDMLLEQAVRDRASDIHIVPDHDSVRVRYRVDGILTEALSLPQGSHYQILSRIKVLAGMNIAERRRPQDGQFSDLIGGEETFFRVATSDTTWGEMATIRILGRTDSIINLDILGMQPEIMESFQRIIQSPFGMMLVAGPTGSGKTTTLYAAINKLDRSRNNILTIEDPVEYNFQGINQIQVNRAADITFASGLRGIMRLDPDKIMIGEIRDTETASSAIQASLTGHLVLSSIHANDSAGTLFRLIHLGIDHFLINSSVLGMVSQRLIRLSCPHCSTMVKPSADISKVFEIEMGEPLKEYKKGEGCSYCHQTGYLGRTGVFELLVMDNNIRKMFSSGASANEIKSAAIEKGMVSMLKDGLTKVKQGLTTPIEVLRTVYSVD
ncbi:MAG: type II secretion system protein GspE [Chloroflexota bacterium]|nr:MAG: type II secretion system protein GspE [Chloroflexota bacterium]HDD62649.1 GspE/PulE family protein [Chloroflexota bacterium]